MDDLFDRSGARLMRIIPNMFKVILVLTLLGALGAFIAMVADEVNFFLALIIVAASAVTELGTVYFILLNLYAKAEASDNSYLILGRMGKTESGKETWKKVQAAVAAEPPKQPEARETWEKVQAAVAAEPPKPAPVTYTADGNALVCPKCGTSQRSYRQSCYQCGQRFEKPAQTAPAEEGSAFSRDLRYALRYQTGEGMTAKLRQIAAKEEYAQYRAELESILDNTPPSLLRSATEALADKHK